MVEFEHPVQCLMWWWSGNLATSMWYPVPKCGGQNCSELGKSTATRNCSRKLFPSKLELLTWSLFVFQLSCFKSLTIRPMLTIFLHNYESKFLPCTKPKHTKFFNKLAWLYIITIIITSLLVTCNCGNWTKFSPCSVTCGQGVEIWTRKCDNPAGRFGGNCSKQNVDRETRLCNIKICSGRIS